MKKHSQKNDDNINREKIGKLTISALLVSMAIICGYIEHLIPFDFGIPGIKLGLANITVIIVLYLIGTKEAFLISLLRILICFLLFGNVYSFAYSLAGGIFSLCIMCLMKRFKIFTVTGISICGGVTHNIAQILVAVLFVKSLSIALYLPVLLISGAIMGACIGIISALIIPKIKKIS